VIGTDLLAGPIAADGVRRRLDRLPADCRARAGGLCRFDTRARHCALRSSGMRKQGPALAVPEVAVGTSKLIAYLAIAGVVAAASFLLPAAAGVAV
jgi:hypothetical protein